MRRDMEIETAVDETIDTIPILLEWDKDVQKAAKRIQPEFARFLVDYYYARQKDRIGLAAQVRESYKVEGGPEADDDGKKVSFSAMIRSPFGNGVCKFLFGEAYKVEQQVKTVLDIQTNESAVGRWAKSIYGIGPVLTAGLLAHIDIEKAPTVGHIWSFAGLNPTVVWEKGEKRPWNARLKTICWKVGQSFMKFSNREECFYGRLYREQKEKYQKRNENGDYAEQAKADLATYGKDTEAYGHCVTGKLPPAQIDARARRWVVKVFLSHLHEVMYRDRYGKEPPKPFTIGMMGHDEAHYIAPPL